MKCKVIKIFRDKDNFSVIYKVGEIVDFDTARALSLAHRGLVVVEEKIEEDAPMEQTLFPEEKEQEYVAEVSEVENAIEGITEDVPETEDTDAEASEEVEEPSEVEEEPKVEETVEETPIEEKPKRGRKKNA